jgi:hypothetical protein
MPENLRDMLVRMHTLGSPFPRSAYGVGVRPPVGGEIDYFKSHPEIPAMATEDDSIAFNPFVNLPREAIESLARNEASRVLIDRDSTLSVPPATLGQRMFMQGTGSAYESDPSLLARTMLARLIAGDDSAVDPSGRQTAVADSLRNIFEKRGVKW